VRVLVLDTYYPAFLDRHYADRAGLAPRPYAEQLDGLLARRFGTSDAYSRGFRALGHESAELIVNCEPLQLAWEQEHGVTPRRRGIQSLPGRLGDAGRRRRLYEIACTQTEAFRPDVVYVQDMWFFPARALARLRRQARLLVGQIASPAPGADRLEHFDLVLTSFPHFVARFRSQRIDSEYLKLAFDEAVLEHLRAEGVDPTGLNSRPHAVGFVGGIDPAVHREGTALLELVCAAAPVAVYGYGAERLRPDSAIRRCYRGEAWGLEMYRVYAESRIVLNRHIDVAEGYANNMRLYEATGTGALVMTEAAPNLAELFLPGREVVVYENAGDLVAKIRHYLENDEARQEIARAGQNRTLREHTFARRIAQLAELLESRLNSGSRRPRAAALE
jgi:spore maturation protein CgeB